MSTARIVFNVLGAAILLTIVVVGYLQLTRPRLRDDGPNGDQVQGLQQAQAQQQQQERAQIASNPDPFLEESDVQIAHTGFINDYFAVKSFSLLNRSHFPLRDIRGMVEWLDSSGNVMGTTAFSLGGSLPAGDTKHYSTGDGSLASVTIKGQADKARMTFTHAEPVN